MDELPKDKKIILFDGVCNLCDASVQYVIKHDKKDVFRFVQMQSELGKKIATHIGIDTTKIDTFIVYDPGIAYYIKSEAAFKVAAALGGFHFINWCFFGFTSKYYKILPIILWQKTVTNGMVKKKVACYQLQRLAQSSYDKYHGIYNFCCLVLFNLKKQNYDKFIFTFIFV